MAPAIRAFVLGLILALNATAMAQQPFVPNTNPSDDIRLGGVVVALENTTLRLGQRVLAEVPQGAQLQVREISGDWVHVAIAMGGVEQQGWVERRVLTAGHSLPGESRPPVRESGTAPVQCGMAPALEKEISFDLGGGVRLEMVLIPAGEFLMGSPDSDKNALNREKPPHRVRITKPFYLGKYLVTQQQWEAVVLQNASFFRGPTNPSHFTGPKNPVERVSWWDCQDFVTKLNEKFSGRGGKFTLPTEAQWEYACRAGSTTLYCCGDDEAALGEFAWYQTPFGLATHPVGEKKPNAWGLYDMHGNIWEWCQDSFDEGYYGHSPVDDPAGPPEGAIRVIRGGGWISGGNGVDRDGGWTNFALSCRSAYRNGLKPGYRLANLGFRVARAAADK
jgi:formylglycine-generating enzyme required for sulfatase activity